MPREVSFRRVRCKVPAALVVPAVVRRGGGGRRRFLRGRRINRPSALPRRL